MAPLILILLADGRVYEVRAANGGSCFGTNSNIRISLFTDPNIPYIQMLEATNDYLCQPFILILGANGEMDLRFKEESLDDFFDDDDDDDDDDVVVETDKNAMIIETSFQKVAFSLDRRIMQAVYHGKDASFYFLEEGGSIFRVCCKQYQLHHAPSGESILTSQRFSALTECLGTLLLTSRNGRHLLLLEPSDQHSAQKTIRDATISIALTKRRMEEAEHSLSQSLDRELSAHNLVFDLSQSVEFLKRLQMDRSLIRCQVKCIQPIHSGSLAVALAVTIENKSMDYTFDDRHWSIYVSCCQGPGFKRPFRLGREDSVTCIFDLTLDEQFLQHPTNVSVFLVNPKVANPNNNSATTNTTFPLIPILNSFRLDLLHFVQIEKENRRLYVKQQDYQFHENEKSNHEERFTLCLAKDSPRSIEQWLQILLDKDRQE